MTLRAIHRQMYLATEPLPHIGWLYRVDRVSRSGRVIDSAYVSLDCVVWA